MRRVREQKSVRYVQLLATLAIAAMLCSVGFLLWGLHDRELNRSRMETINLTQLVVQQAQRQFESLDNLLLAVQERLQTPYGFQQDLAGDSVRLLLNSRVAGLQQVRSLMVLDAKGLLVNASRNFAPPDTSLAQADYFRAFAQAADNTLFIGKPVAEDGEGATLHLARPLRGRQGELRGVLVVALDVPAFERLFGAMQWDYARPIGFYLADATLFASWPPRAADQAATARELAAAQPCPGLVAQTVRCAWGDTVQEPLAVGRLNGYAVLVSVHNSEYQGLAPWRETAWPIAIGAVLVSIFIGLLAVYLAGKLRLKQQLTVALSAADQRYQHTVNAVMDAIVAVDESQRVVLFNPSAEKMFGYASADILGQSLDRLIPPRLQAAHRAHIHQFSQSDTASRATAVQTEVLGLRADGSEFPLESTISRSVIGGRMQLTAVLRDATERRRAEAELRLANSQLRELSASLQSVREEERKRISRELHDDLGQQLTGLKLSLSWLGSRLKDGKSASAEDVDEMRYQLDTAIGSVRRLATELRPRALDDVDFGEALTEQTAEFFKHSGIQIALDLQGADQVQDDALATALYRIVQEALTNVVRHAAATQVDVSLRHGPQGLHLTVADNGRGFDGAGRAAGMGLVSMRERCSAVGASFGVHSTPGQGTRIEVVMPPASPSPTPSALETALT